MISKLQIRCISIAHCPTTVRSYNGSSCWHRPKSRKSSDIPVRLTENISSYLVIARNLSSNINRRYSIAITRERPFVKPSIAMKRFVVDCLFSIYYCNIT